MKIIKKEEIDAIQWAATSIESLVDFFESVYLNDILGSEDLGGDTHIFFSDDVSKKIDILKNIVSSKDYNVTDHDKFMMTIGREQVNPNFNFCVLSESLMDTLYLTDDYETALKKAKSLSIITKDHVFSVFSIKNTTDGYKTFYEMQYDGGNPVEPSSYMFLHYDYLAQSVKNIVKL